MQAPGSASLRRKIGGLLSRRAWFVAAVVLFAVSTALALRQEPRDPDDVATPLSWRWWSTPVEWNAARRLPYFPVPLEAVVVDWEATIRTVGADRTVFESTDGGAAWAERDDLRPRPPEDMKAGDK